MYLPTSFAEEAPERLFDLIESYSFGVLFSSRDAQPMASHLPLLLDRREGPRGVLWGHMARANPQWRTAGGQGVLAVFSGPHTYVSPAWYESEQVVPTWNYVAVHVEGRLETIDDLPATIETVRRTVEKYEGARPAPWTMDPADPYIEHLAAQIVAFRIPIERIEGKWKLSQNQPRERQEKVVRALSERTDDNSREIADLMRKRLEEG